MGANGCTFVFSIFSAKRMYFILENQKQGYDKFFQTIFWPSWSCKMEIK